MAEGRTSSSGGSLLFLGGSSKCAHPADEVLSSACLLGVRDRRGGGGAGVGSTSSGLGLDGGLK